MSRKTLISVAALAAVALGALIVPRDGSPWTKGTECSRSVKLPRAYGRS